MLTFAVHPMNLHKLFIAIDRSDQVDSFSVSKHIKFAKCCYLHNRQFVDVLEFPVEAASLWLYYF